MDQINIRTAAIADAELIADISHQTFYHTYAHHNTKENMDKFFAEQFSKEQLMAQVGESGNTFLLAYVNDQPAGYIFLKDDTKENAIEIARLYAVTSFIGQGIGKALMNAAIAYSKNKHKKFIWLCVWEHNPNAIQFYTKCGFQKFGEHEFLLGEDVQVDWMMRLLISS